MSKVLLVISCMLLAACTKKEVVRNPAPVPSAGTAQPRVELEPAPARSPVSVSFTVEPGVIEPGQNARLRWTVVGASQVTITPAIGRVPEDGMRNVSPGVTTQYRLTAQGAAGEVSAAATVQIVRAPPIADDTLRLNPPSDIRRRLAAEAPDTYFEYDRADITDQSRPQLSHTAYVLRTIFDDFPNARLVVEGHCDERGSAEYNIALGDRRASAVRSFLLQFGIAPERLSVVSWGKELPECTQSNEDCWRRNRRVHFAAEDRVDPVFSSSR